MSRKYIPDKQLTEMENSEMENKGGSWLRDLTLWDWTFTFVKINFALFISFVLVFFISAFLLMVFGISLTTLAAMISAILGNKTPAII